METRTQPITEKQIAADFERIDEEVRSRASEFLVEELAPPAAPPSEDEVVVEPVYAYTLHAVS
jgi:hypothetical protein